MRKILPLLFILGIVVSPNCLLAKYTFNNNTAQGMAQYVIDQDLWNDLEEQDLSGGYNYFKNRGKVYAQVSADSDFNSTTFPVQMKGADLKTFQNNSRSDYFGRDKNSVYFLNKKIKGADPKTFIPLEEFSDYGMDKNGVYAQDKKIENADRNSFERLNSPFSRDKNHVYFQERTLKDADVSSFEVLDACYYAKDKNSIYHNGSKKADFDVKTFKILSASNNILFHEINCYVQDKNGIYFDDKRIGEADPSSFELLTSYDTSSFVKPDYAKDKNHAYYLGKIIPGVDISTFKAVDNGKAKDKNEIYIKGQKIDFFDKKRNGYIPVKIFLATPDKSVDINSTTEDDLSAVSRYIPKTKAVAQKTLELLLLGPNNQETEANYFTEIPFESEIRSIKVAHGEIRVDFNNAVEGGRQGFSSMVVREEQIRKTLSQFPGIKSVKISVQGRTKNIFPAGE